MKKKTVYALIFVTALALALTACQGLPLAPASAPTQAPPSPTPQPAATLPPTPPPTPPPTEPAPLSATPTRDVVDEPAAAALAYASALAGADYAAAADMLSDYSLSEAGLTRGEAAAALRTAAAGKNFSIQEPSQIDGDTALVTVVTLEDTQTWAFRRERGEWRFNYGGLIDTKTLEGSAQTTAGVTLKPRRLARYTDRIALELLAQNRTGEVVVLGQPNETLASFEFDGEKVTAEQNRIVLEPLRSYPTVTIEVKGLFAAFPDAVDIRIWKDYQVEPWFSFDLSR